MLIHRKTMGALQKFWTGEIDALNIPVELEYTFKNAPDLDPSEWWEVPLNSKLGRKIRLHYPWIIPITGPDGELVDVELEHEGNSEFYEKQELRKMLQKSAQERGYKQAYRVRPKNIMPFLTGGIAR